MLIITKFSHMTDIELVRLAFIEAKTDMERELMKRLARAINEIAEQEETIEQMELDFEEVPLQ